MANNTSELLLGSRQKSWHVFECQDRNLKSIAETHEPSRFCGRIDVQASGKIGGLVCDNADGLARYVCKPDHDISSEMFRDFEEISVIDHPRDYVFDVVRLVRFDGYQRVELS